MSAFLTGLESDYVRSQIEAQAEKMVGIAGFLSNGTIETYLRGKWQTWFYTTHKTAMEIYKKDPVISLGLLKSKIKRAIMDDKVLYSQSVEWNEKLEKKERNDALLLEATSIVVGLAAGALATVVTHGNLYVGVGVFALVDGASTYLLFGTEIMHPFRHAMIENNFYTAKFIDGNTVTVKKYGESLSPLREAIKKNKFTIEK